MRPELVALFERLKDPMFLDAPVDDVNATTVDGDNALHWAARENDLEAARLLIEAGINVNQRGDLGNTPLHEACAGGHGEMVLLLVSSGADLYARNEGGIPFTTARITGHDDICDLLGPLMEEAQRASPDIWTRATVAHLRREIERLEKEVARLEKSLT